MSAAISAAEGTAKALARHSTAGGIAAAGRGRRPADVLIGLGVRAEHTQRFAVGARSLEGLNVRVDAQRKQLVPAGPILAGAVASQC